MSRIKLPDGQPGYNYPVIEGPTPLTTLAEFITLVHQIKLAAGASRGIPDGDTIALREIVDMIKHFEATH